LIESIVEYVSINKTVKRYYTAFMLSKFNLKSSRPKCCSFLRGRKWWSPRSTLQPELPWKYCPKFAYYWRTTKKLSSDFWQCNSLKDEKTIKTPYVDCVRACNVTDQVVLGGVFVKEIPAKTLSFGQRPLYISPLF